MNEADRIARERLRAEQQAQAAKADAGAQQLATDRRKILQEIQRLTDSVLPLLKAAGYPDMESLTFQRKTVLGGFKDEVRGGWLLGQFYFPGSNAAGEGDQPLHLLSDGSFAAFGYSRLTLSEFDDATWWNRKAPETILVGLRELHRRLRQAS